MPTRTLLLAAVLLTSFVPLLAQDAAATKAQRARQLLMVMRTDVMGAQIIDSMIESMKGALPDAGEEFWTAFRKKAKASDFVGMLVPVYAKNLETADMDELIRFYSSPAGQRFLDTQPVIMRESMEIGQKWGAELAMEAMQEMQKSKSQE